VIVPTITVPRLKLTEPVLVWFSTKDARGKAKK
jgi:hypothetical protein